MTRHHALRSTALALSTALAALALAAPAEAHGSAADPLPAVTPRAETPALYDDEAVLNADADDPAIWRNASDPDRSLVIATAKEAGLRVYDLDARQVQAIQPPSSADPDDAPGRFNNVDLVTGLRLSSGRADVAVTSDRGNDRLRIYRIDRDRPRRPAHRHHRPGRRSGLLQRAGRDQRPADGVRSGHLDRPHDRALLRAGQPP